MEPIIAYSAYWHAETDTGRIFLKLQNGQSIHIDLDSPAELTALCALLKDNPQMVYDTNEKLLSTTWLKPGG
jgi:hypothetical protein